MTAKTKSTPRADGLPASWGPVIEYIADLYREARRGRMGGHRHWGRLIVAKLRTLADVDASRLDDFESDGEETATFAALVQSFVETQDARLAKLAHDNKEVPWYGLADDTFALAIGEKLDSMAHQVVGAFEHRMSELNFENAAVGPCTFEDGCRWYEGDQLDADGDGDGSDPREPKPWRYQYRQAVFPWLQGHITQIDFKRKWGAFDTWARLEDRVVENVNRFDVRERRAVINYAGEPRAILGWEIERTQLTGEVPCPRCNYGDERKIPEILRQTCPFCDAINYFHSAAQIVVYRRNK